MNERPQPREEMMLLAAKLVLLADERSAAAAVGATTSEGEQEGQQSSQEPNTGPPTLIVIPEQDDIQDDLDSITASIPVVLARLVQPSESKSAEALNRHLQQITNELVDAVRKQVAESLSNEHTMDPRPTLATTESSQDGTLLPTEGDTATRNFGVDPPASPTVDVDPPASHAIDAHSFDRKPDPPALQVLIGDLLKKEDPSGSIPRAGSPTPTEMQEQKSVSSSLVPPLEAHVVHEDQAWGSVEQLNETIMSLQQQLSQIPEARILPASEVTMEDNDNDAPSFFEIYGTTILMTCLVFGVGILAASRTRHGGGHS